MCPRCQLEFEVHSGVESGGSSFSDQKKTNLSIPDPNPKASESPDRRRARVRGKGREYSGAFEVAWKAYGRREEKLRAYGEWIVQARANGGENQLLPQILSALAWQSPIWAADGWRFAPYFERYLKRRKWEDERPPQIAPARAAVKPWVAAERAEEQRKSAERAQSRLALEKITAELAAAKGTGR